MTDSQRGNTTHGPRLDEEMKHEIRGMIQGHVGTAHAEPFRETEPLPDDTDDIATERGFRNDHDERRDDIDTDRHVEDLPVDELAGDADADDLGSDEDDLAESDPAEGGETS